MVADEGGRLDPDVAYGQAREALRRRIELSRDPFEVVQTRPEQGRFPDFLVVGVQKSGTTWLHRNLSYHPEAWLPPIKELNYFNEVYLPSVDGWETSSRLSEVDIALQLFNRRGKLNKREAAKVNALQTIRENELTDDWYARIFSNASDDQICGEVSPEYAQLPRVAITRILNKNAALKIVVILRDPIDRAWSHIRMEALRSERDLDSWFLSDQRWGPILSRSNYPAMLRRWLSVFPAANVAVFSYDDLARDGVSFLEKLCGFLGAAFDARFFPLAGEVAREGMVQEMSPKVLDALRARMEFIYRGLAETHSHIARPWISRHYA